VVVSDVSFDFLKVEALLMIRQFLLQGAGLDVVKSNSPENILWRIAQHNRSGISSFADHFPKGTADRLAATQSHNDRCPRARERVARPETLRGENHATSGVGFAGAQSTFHRDAPSRHPNRRSEF